MYCVNGSHSRLPHLIGGSSIAYTLLALYRAVTLRSDEHRAMRWKTPAPTDHTCTCRASGGRLSAAGGRVR